MSEKLCGYHCGYCGRCDDEPEYEYQTCIWCGYTFDARHDENLPYCSRACAIAAERDSPEDDDAWTQADEDYFHYGSRYPGQ